VEQVIDFGHAKNIFPDADVFPSNLGADARRWAIIGLMVWLVVVGVVALAFVVGLFIRKVAGTG
jgi:hypothetical protein